jgi:hypothetical protein
MLKKIEVDVDVDDIKKLDAEGKRSEDEEPEFYMHRVTSSDTAAGVCLRYNIKIQTLRELNPTLRSMQNIQACRDLKVPVKKLSPEQLHLFKFENQHRANIQALRTKAELTEPEAKYYLDMHDGDFESALQEALEDLEWEKANGKKSEAVSTTTKVPTKKSVAQAKTKKGRINAPPLPASSALEMVGLSTLDSELTTPKVSVQVLMTRT